MKRALLFLLALCATARASYITNEFAPPGLKNGFPSITVKFNPTQTPYFLNLSNTIYNVPVGPIVATNGYLAPTWLWPGNYNCVFGPNGDSIIINVPNDTNSYSLGMLATNFNAVSNFNVYVTNLIAYMAINNGSPSTLTIVTNNSTNLTLSAISSGITNGQSGVTLSGTFSGNGAGLNNITGASISSPINTNVLPGALPQVSINNGGSLTNLTASNLVGDGTFVGTFTPSNAPLVTLPIAQAPNIPVFNLNAQYWTNVMNTRVTSNQFFTNVNSTGPYLTNDLVVGHAFFFPGDGSYLQSISNLNESSSTYLTVMWLDNNFSAPSSTTIGWYTIGGELYMMRANTHLIVGSGLPQSALPYFNGWTLNTLVFSNGTFWIRINGMTSYEPTGSWSALGINAQLNYGDDSGFAWNGELAELVAWTNCFSQSTLQKLELGMLQRHGLMPQRQLLFVGDSIVFGEEGGYSNIQYFVSQIIGASSNYTFCADGNPGAFMSGMESYVSAYDLIPSLQPIVILEGGINDLENGVSVSNTFTNFQNYVAHYRTNGATKIVYCTPTPFSTTIMTNTVSEPLRQSYLTLISNNWPSFVDALADWGNDSIMGTTNNLFNTNFFPQESGPDYVHPSGTGNQILGTQHTAPAIQGVAKGFGGVY